MTKGRKTEKCQSCRKNHLKCKRDFPTQAQCNKCKEKGVGRCTDEFPPLKQRTLNPVSRSPTQQSHHPRSYQRPLTRSSSSPHHSDDDDSVEAAQEPGPPKVSSSGSSSFNAESDCGGVLFKYEKKLEKCREWLRLHEYLCAIAKSPGKLESDSQKKSPGTIAREKVSESLLGPIYNLCRCEIENSSNGAMQAERFLLQLQLAIVQFQRRIPADESIHLLDLEITAVGQKVHVVESLSTNSTVSKEIQLTREVLKREELDLTKRRQECGSSQLPAQAYSANESNYSTPTSALPQVSTVHLPEVGGSQIADIQHEVAEASRDFLTGPCPNKRVQTRGGKPPAFFPLLFCALLCGSDHVARASLENTPDIKSLLDWSGKTIAHIAAQSGRISLLGSELLTANRLKFDRKDSFGLTPVMIAAIHAPLECLRLLINAKYRIGERDMQGRSLVSVAARHGRTDVVEYLINEGIGLPNDQHGVDRCSPIYEAVVFGIESQDMSTCLLLLTRGANPYVPVHGQDAATLAKESTPGYLGLLLNLWESTQAGNNFDEYSGVPFAPAINRQLASAGPSGDPNPVHPSSTMAAQAANQTDQADFQEFRTPCVYGLTSDQQLNLERYYAMQVQYPGFPTIHHF